MRRSPGRLGLLSLAVTLVSCADSTGTGGGTPIPHGNINVVANAATRGAHAFAPDTLTISLGTTGKVVWANQDVGDGVYGVGTTHAIISDDGTTFNLGNLNPGRTYSFTFTTAGTYTYHCAIHPTMVGAVVVTP